MKKTIRNTYVIRNWEKERESSWNLANFSQKSFLLSKTGQSRGLSGSYQHLLKSRSQQNRRQTPVKLRATNTPILSSYTCQPPTRSLPSPQVRARDWENSASPVNRTNPGVILSSPIRASHGIICWGAPAASRREHDSLWQLPSHPIERGEGKHEQERAQRLLLTGQHRIQARGSRQLRHMAPSSRGRLKWMLGRLHFEATAPVTNWAHQR